MTPSWAARADTGLVVTQDLNEPPAEGAGTVATENHGRRREARARGRGLPS